MSHHPLSPLIDKCRKEDNFDTQISMLKEINKSLPASERLIIPSLITEDYVFRALEMIEEMTTASRMLSV
jgi:hypothetical protein